jgi:bifunctional DNA-binding transcriptional regulator/antitoxin component of YhaV-PrlF toxin-antitoxin module
MAKFMAKVIGGYRITIDEDVRKVLGIEIGDRVEVDIKVAQKAEKAVRRRVEV